jgi:uncharacterized protein with GYD domain
MATYIMLGKYSGKGIKGASAARSNKAIEVVEKHGGKLKDVYALLGDVDLVVIVDLPDTAAAVKTSLALTRLLGVTFSTSPALPYKEFDKLLS